jgi:signal peptidase
MLRQLLHQCLTFLLVVSAVFMQWKSLSLITDSPSPVVVVISESMEPAFQWGNLLFLWNRDNVIEIGEIAVRWFGGRNLPTVHRVVKSFLRTTSSP